MKRVFGCAVVALLLSTSGTVAQFKGSNELKPSVSESMNRSGGDGLILGFFDPAKFSMRHNFSLSYSTFGSNSMSLGVYTNNLMYQFSDDLELQADVSLMHSPFNSFGKQFQNDLSGVFLSRAELNYRPSKNTLFSIQYRQLPPMYWLGNGYYRPSMFDGIDRYQGDIH